MASGGLPKTAHRPHGAQARSWRSKNATARRGVVGTSSNVNMPLSAEQQRERRARAFAEKHGPGFRARPRGPPPSGFPNWDGIGGVWRNNAGETAAERQRLNDAVWQAKARKQGRRAEYGTPNFTAVCRSPSAVFCAALPLAFSSAFSSPMVVDQQPCRRRGRRRTCCRYRTGGCDSQRAHGRVLPPTEQARATVRTQTQHCGARRLPTHPTWIDFSLAVWKTTEDIEGRMAARGILDRTWVGTCEPKRQECDRRTDSGDRGTIERCERAERGFSTNVKR